jgi:hypothetical protein
MPRPIDHLVIAVNDLEAARAAYARLGFTLTPPARHPFGTMNSLVQLDGAFLELLAVADPDAIVEPGEGRYSFAAFNRDYLAAGEGISMLVLKSGDPAADRADFESRGLPVYAPFGFERTARGPDGAERRVAFELTFTSDARLRRAGFFTCRNLFPENFWKAEYQRHPNGASRIESVVMSSRDPADFHEFMTHFTGQHDIRSDSLGVDFDTGGGHVEVLSPVAVKAFFGEDAGPDPRRFLAFRVTVADLSATAALLAGNGVSVRRLGGALVVPADAACGAAIAFAAEGA